MVPVGQVYKQQLIEEGVITEDEYQVLKNSINSEYEESYKKCKEATFESERW